MKYLFVFGCPRSGTTALGFLLNLHPVVALGIERYKYIAIGKRGREFLPELFEKTRFLDIRADDTNTQIYNRHLAQKYASRHTVEMIGDKIPRLYRRLARLRATFPEAYFVVIFRDPVDVALSWQTRADSPRDAWPTENGAVKALVEWLDCVNIIADAQAVCGEKLIIVDYDRFFRVPNAADLAGNIKRLYIALGLEVKQVNLLRAAETMRDGRPNRSDTERTLPNHLTEQAITLRQNARYRALLDSAI